MKIKSKKIDKSLVVAIHGDNDIYGSIELRKQLDGLIDQGEMHLILNLKKCQYIDSSGLGVFIAIKSRLERNDGSFALVNIGKNIKRTIEMSNLADVFVIAASIESAVSDQAKK